MKPKSVKLNCYQVKYMLKNWDKLPIEDIAKELKTTEYQVAVFGGRINSAIPAACIRNTKPKTEVK